MTLTRGLLYASVAAGLMIPSHGAWGQAADNSSQNKDHTQSADKQSNVQSDRTTTAQIRRALVADKGLSTYAHNVKVLVQNGSVTLKGPVRSGEEKQKVLADAGSVVSSDKISDQLTVKQ